jgi:internalin A
MIASPSVRGTNPTTGSLQVVRLLACIASACIFTLGGLVPASGTLAQDLFPDKALEAAVRQEVFAKRYNEEPLTVEDVAKISQVVAKGAGIASLSGLEHCAALMLVDLEENQIEDLSPLADLKLLQSVNLAKNQIQSLEALAGLTAMQYLELSGNRIEDLTPLSKMDNMRSLYLSDNKITSLQPIVGLSKIWTLYAARNPLGEIAGINQLKWLSSLDLAGSHLESLDFLKGLTELHYVNLEDNKISDWGPLVSMAEEDAAGQKRFAPFLRLYIHGNPLEADGVADQLAALRKIGTRVFVEPAIPVKTDTAEAQTP